MPNLDFLAYVLPIIVLVVQTMQTMPNGFTHFLIGLCKFPLQSVYVNMVCPGQTPQGLIGADRNSQQGVARQGSVAIAMCMQGQTGVTAQSLQRGIAYPVLADHDATASFALDQICVAFHGIGFVRNVESKHHMLAAALFMSAYHFHDSRDALMQRRVGRVGADLIILDEVHPGIAQGLHQLHHILSAQPHAGFDDGADHGVAYYTST